MSSLIRAALAALLMFPLLSAYAESGLQPICTISLTEWESPDRTHALLSDPALRTLVQAWEAQPGNLLRIEYPAGEQGELWASRMQAWLVTFGIPRAAVQLQPGGSPNALALSLQPGQGGGA